MVIQPLAAWNVTKQPRLKWSAPSGDLPGAPWNAKELAPLVVGNWVASVDGEGMIESRLLSGNQLHSWQENYHFQYVHDLHQIFQPAM